MKSISNRVKIDWVDKIVFETKFVASQCSGACFLAGEKERGEFVDALTFFDEAGYVSVDSFLFSR